MRNGGSRSLCRSARDYGGEGAGSDDGTATGEGTADAGAGNGTGFADATLCEPAAAAVGTGLTLNWAARVLATATVRTRVAAAGGGDTIGGAVMCAAYYAANNGTNDNDDGDDDRCNPPSRAIPRTLRDGGPSTILQSAFLRRAGRSTAICKWLLVCRLSIWNWR